MIHTTTIRLNDSQAITLAGVNHLDHTTLTLADGKQKFSVTLDDNDIHTLIARLQDLLDPDTPYEQLTYWHDDNTDTSHQVNVESVEWQRVSNGNYELRVRVNGNLITENLIIEIQSVVDHEMYDIPLNLSELMAKVEKKAGCELYAPAEILRDVAINLWHMVEFDIKEKKFTDDKELEND